MEALRDILSQVDPIGLIHDPRFLVGLAVVSGALYFLKWKTPLVILWAVIGITLVVQWVVYEGAGDEMQGQVVYFIGGVFGVSLIAIYWLFIKE